VIIRLIGSGGLGAVYLARDEELDRSVAIKLNRAGSWLGPEGRARFKREAMAVARLQHPNIASIHDVGEEGGFSYTVLEYVDGGDLGQKLRDGPFPPEAAARLMAALARAVDYAHSLGILHRDLKPSNILLTLDGTPKIGDFGLAKLMGEREAGITSPGTFMGTPSYMAPEQTRGELRSIGRATDIYALGTILYELLAGRRPFEGGTPIEMMMQVREAEPEPPSRWRPEVPRDLDAICLKCLEKDPSLRYSTAGDLAEDLERFLAGRAVFARKPTVWRRFLRRLLRFK
jgi:serine/threonine-protein kinase